MTKIELQARSRELQGKMSDLNDKAYNEKRSFTEEEQREWDHLTREKTIVDSEIENMLNERELAQFQEHKSKGEQLREILREAQQTGQKREILLKDGTNSSGTSNVTANIEASGAITLTIHELIPTLHEGLDLPKSLNIVTGVKGNEVWPVSINDVEMEEVGEVDALGDQVLDFAKINPIQRRCGLKVPVSNMAIDNSAFDLMAFVQAKFISNLTPAGTITLGSGQEYAAILDAVAAFSNKGFFEGDVTIILDRVTEARLKATPKIAGAAGGFIIENGLCAGYPYIVTHYLNTELDTANKLVRTSDLCIGIGYFEWLAVQQHGDVRLVVDPITLADRNVTRVILNTAWSITDLSVFINGGEPTSATPPVYPTQAFALYTVQEQSDPTTL